MLPNKERCVCRDGLSFLVLISQSRAPLATLFSFESSKYSPIDRYISKIFFYRLSRLFWTFQSTPNSVLSRSLLRFLAFCATPTFVKRRIDKIQSQICYWVDSNEIFRELNSRKVWGNPAEMTRPENQSFLDVPVMEIVTWYSREVNIWRAMRESILER
jgi:hypothetical protein